MKNGISTTRNAPYAITIRLNGPRGGSTGSAGATSDASSVFSCGMAGLYQPHEGDTLSNSAVSVDVTLAPAVIRNVTPLMAKGSAIDASVDHAPGAVAPAAYSKKS